MKPFMISMNVKCRQSVNRAKNVSLITEHLPNVPSLEESERKLLLDLFHNIPRK